MIGQNSLNNFYQSVQFSNPLTAALMADDVFVVAINALGADKSGGQAAANRLREKSTDLPEVLKRVLETALTDLGYE